MENEVAITNVQRLRRAFGEARSLPAIPTTPPAERTRPILALPAVSSVLHASILEGIKSVEQVEYQVDHDGLLGDSPLHATQFRQIVAETRPILNALRDGNTTILPEAAASLSQLSLRCLDLGLRQEALCLQDIAVAIYQGLIQSRSAHTSPFPLSIYLITSPVWDVGTRKQLSLCRQRAGNTLGRIQHVLAAALFTLSNHLSSLGHREDALRAIRESVALRRTLGESHAELSLDLVSYLNNLSNQLSGLGRRDEALRIVEEAVDLCRSQAVEQPATLSPRLAGSLDNLSTHLAGVGRRDEGLRAIQEAVQLYQQLVGDNPMSFNSALASAFDTLSSRLSDLNRLEEALAAIQEGLKLRQALAQSLPSVFNSDLVTSLVKLSTRLVDLGRKDDALSPAETALYISRKLAAGSPGAFDHTLTMSLKNISTRLSDLGRLKDALPFIQESTELCRELASRYPAAFNPDVAMSLNHLSTQLSGLGRQEEALQVIKEAVSLREDLAKDYPDAFSPVLAASLNNLSTRLSDAGRPEEALRTIEEAVEIRRKLADRFPSVFDADLASSLDLLSPCLVAVGREDDTLLVVQEASAIHQTLAENRHIVSNADIPRPTHSPSPVRPVVVGPSSIRDPPDHTQAASHGSGAPPALVSLSMPVPDISASTEEQLAYSADGTEPDVRWTRRIIMFVCRICDEPILGIRYQCCDCSIHHSEPFDMCGQCLGASKCSKQFHCIKMWQPQAYRSGQPFVSLMYECDSCSTPIPRRDKFVHCFDCVQAFDCDTNLCLGCYYREATTATHDLTHNVALCLTGTYFRAPPPPREAIASCDFCCSYFSGTGGFSCMTCSQNPGGYKLCNICVVRSVDHAGHDLAAI